MKRHIFAITLLVLSSFWAINPLFSPGFFTMHDDTQVARVIVMGKALRQGQFPVRWVTDLGYGFGYPIFNFYGPLPYYIGGSFYALGVDAIVATKIMFGLGIVLAGVTMYVLASSLLGSAAGVLSGVLYMYAPYHAVQIYIRGAVGEFWVLVFLPIIFLGLWLAFKNKLNASSIGGAGLAGVILSHTILGFVTVVFLVFFGVFYWGYRLIRKNVDIHLLSSHIFLLAIGLGLSIFFWLPAISEMRYTSVSGQIGGSADFRNHFVCISQLWDSTWGFGGSAAGCIDGLSFKLGKILFVLPTLSLVLWFIRRNKIQKINWIFWAVIVICVSIFFMLSQSEVLWNILPFFPFIQYPWRFLTFLIFGLSLLSGVFILAVKRLQWFFVSICIPLIIFMNGKLFMPQYNYPQSSQVFEDKEYLRYFASKISDEYLPPEVKKPQGKTEIAQETISKLPGLGVDVELNTDTYARFIVTSDADRVLSINKTYFPGWEFLVNGKRVIPKIVGGLPELFVPAGTNVIEISLTNTPVRTIANILTIMTILTLLIFYGKKTIA